MQGVKPEISAIRKSLIRELNSKKFQDEIKNLEGKDYINYCLAIMEFCLPKLQRTEFSGEVTTKETVVFEIAGQKIPFQAVKQN